MKTILVNVKIVSFKGGVSQLNINIISMCFFIIFNVLNVPRWGFLICSLDTIKKKISHLRFSFFWTTKRTYTG